LALAMTTLRMSGMLEGKGLDGEWRPFGQFVLANREEFDPPLPLGFPLEVGRSFSSNHTAYLSGAYELVFAGLPINNSYEKQQAWTVNGQIVSLENQTDCQFQDPSYRVEMTYLQDGQTGAKSLWIEPRIKSFNKEVRSQFQHPLGVIRSSVLCLTAAHVAQDPEPSPTPSPKFIDLQLRLNKSEFLAGDGFELRISADNSGVPVSARLFVVLDISALGVAEPYYFWPSWIHFPHGVDSALWELPAGFAEQTLLSFIWPAGAGSSAGLAFWAAALDPSGMELWGEIATVKFGFR